MVGVPIEFPNVCECLQFIHSKENINIHTQVIGLAVGKREDIYPTNCKYPKIIIRANWVAIKSAKLMSIKGWLTKSKG